MWQSESVKCRRQFTCMTASFLHHDNQSKLLPQLSKLGLHLGNTWCGGRVTECRRETGVTVSISLAAMTTTSWWRHADNTAHSLRTLRSVTVTTGSTLVQLYTTTEHITSVTDLTNWTSVKVSAHYIYITCIISQKTVNNRPCKLMHQHIKELIRIKKINAVKIFNTYHRIAAQCCNRKLL